MIFYPEFTQEPNLENLTKELQAALTIDNAACGNDGRFYVEVPDHITLEQVQTIVDNHNPALLTTGQLEAAQAVNAKNALAQLMTGLHNLSAQDKGYALYCRILAARNNATPQVIAGITDRASAVAYVTGLSVWQNTAANTKPMLQLMLETNAGLCQILFIVLSLD